MAVTVDDVVQLIEKLRKDGAPAYLREVCDIVDETTGAITSQSIELDAQVRPYIHNQAEHKSDDFHLWAWSTLGVISDVLLHLKATTGSISAEPPPFMVQSVRETLPDDVQPGWLDRLRVILTRKPWITH